MRTKGSSTPLALTLARVFEGAFDEIVQGEKENLHAGENHANIRHQIRPFLCDRR